MSVRRSLPVVMALVASVLVAPAISTAAVAAPPEPTGAAPRSAAPATPGSGAIDDLGALQGSGPVTVVLQLPQPPASRVWTGTARAGRVAAVRAQREQIRTAQNAVANAASRLAGVKVRYRVGNLYNGVVVSVPADRARALRSIPGVAAVRRVAELQPDNSSSDALIGAPQAWQSHGGLTGQGVRIGIIDTGIDYTHRDFGGSGNFAGNTDRTAVGDSPDYPSAKVAGGWDFVGDNYTGSNTAQSDPDPADCAATSGNVGHGTHVAATAGGYGENSDGSTYTGPYDASTPLSSMRIGPGVAPAATLYALRVFGCSGGTTYVPQALDWAMDPNGDGDFSDHLDVVNISIGSPFGASDAISAVAADNAVAAGVQVVVSGGNNGDVTYAVGAPGSSTRALTVASSVDAGETTDGFSFTPDGGSATVYGGAHSVSFSMVGRADITAPLFVPTERFGCSALTGADAANAAGKIVLWDWRAPGATTFPCGSATRAGNAANAGAVGMVVADNSPAWSTTLTGSSRIPSMITGQPVGDALKAAVPIGTIGGSVTFSAGLLGNVSYDDPGRVDQVSSFSSRGPRLGDNVLKPDISAPGDTIFSAASGTGSGGQTLSGTSMAAPHMAGTMALLHQLHPGWTPEELKALVMDTADADLWSGRSRTGSELTPSREGVGRVDLPASVTGDVVAYGTDLPGAVSLSFGALQVAGTATAVRTLRIADKGTTDATYALGIDPSVTVPGVSYSFPDGDTVTVTAGGTATVRLQLTAVGAQMDNTTDPTYNTSQLGYVATALSESAGHVTLAPQAGTPGPSLRVAYLAVVRPASSMGTAQSSVGFASATDRGTASLTLAGTGVDTGGSRAFTDEKSVVTPLALAATSPRNPQVPAVADLRAVGATSTCAWASTCKLEFGVATYAPWTSPAYQDAEFDVAIDTNNDGNTDYVLYNTRVSTGSGGSTTWSDAYVTAVYRPSSGTQVVGAYLNQLPGSTPSALTNSDAMTLGVTRAQLGNPSGPIRWWVNTYNRGDTGADSAGPFTLDVTDPALDFPGNEVWPDVPGATIPVRYDPARYAAQGIGGVMLVHHFNRTGSTVQLVPAGPAVTAVQVTPASPTLAKGTSTPLTATALLLDGSTQDVTALADWSSSDPAVTVGNTLADKGIVTGSGVGSGTVTATYGGTSGSTGVTVTAATLQSVAVTPADGSLPKGTVQQYAATGTYSDGTTQDLTSSVTWSTGDLAVATVDATGQLTAAGTGTTTVTATLGAITGSTGVTVTAAVLASIAVDPSAPVLHEGTHLPLHATGVYSDGTTTDLTSSAVWSTGDPAVATVDADGVLEGVAGGTTTVTATSGAVSGSGAVTVSDAALQSVAVTPAAARLAAGTQRQFAATGTYADGTQDLTADAVWTSSKPAVAAVSNAAGSQGLVSGLTRGTATLTATVGAVSGSQALTVTPAVLRSLAVTTPSTTVARGESPQFTATGTFSDGSTQDMTDSVLWTSNGRRLVVSNAAGSHGLGVALAAGTATVTARRGAIRASVTVTVTPATLARIEIAGVSVAAGTVARVAARGVFTDGSVRSLTTVAAWQVTDPAVASVAATADGLELVSGLRVGTTTVTATYGGLTGTGTVTVTPGTLRSLAVTPARLTLAAGSTRAYTVRGTFSDGSTQDLTDQVVWSVSSAAASVSNAAGSAGSVTAVSPGSVTVTATLGTIRGTGALTVTP